MTDQRAKQLQMHAEDLLLLMNASKLTSRSFREGGYPIPLRVFDKAEPFLLQDVTHSEFMDAQWLTDVGLRDLPSSLDFTGMGAIEDERDRGNIAAHRLSIVRRPFFPVKVLTRYVVAHRILFLDRPTGVGETAITYYGSNTGAPLKTHPQEWIHLTSGAPLIERSPDMAFLLMFSLGMCFNRDYIWRAHLRWPGAEAGITIPTTPEGARALFRLRDYEEGASRRKALIHWVSEHSRRIRKDTEEETRVWVREHTRGVAKFKWQDMEGAIYPAAADLRRLQQAKGAKR